MPTLDSRLIRTVDAFGAQRQSIIDRVLRAVVGLFVPFEEWTNPDAITRVTSRAGQYVSSGQRAVAGLTDSYLARTTSTIRGATVSPVGVGPEMSGVLRDGVDSWIKVYSRLPAEYRWQRSLGRSKEDALDAVLNRAREMASEDLGLAHRDQAAKFTRARNVAHYRRVIRGENTCGLCVAASTRIYTKADLLPIHGRCRCSVMAVGDTDPAQDINDDALEQAYKDALAQTKSMGGNAPATSGEKLKKVRFEVVQHGELGPQLRVKGQGFRGPSEVAKDAGSPASSDSGFWTRPNVERQLESARNAPNREWGAKQAARYEKWLAEN